MKIEDTPLFLINKIKFKTPDGIEDFYRVHSIERMLENDTFYSFTDRMRDIFIKALSKEGNVKQPHKEFSFYHFYKGIKEEIKELDNILCKTASNNLTSKYEISINDYKAIQKECLDVANYTKFIFDKSELRIKEIGDKK